MHTCAWSRCGPLANGTYGSRQPADSATTEPGSDVQSNRSRPSNRGLAGLSRMLVRSAQGLYWMSRYVERARRLCRLLQLQTESLVDRPIREIHFGWSRIYESVNRQPPAGKIELLGGDDYTLAGDLTFERSNPARCGAVSTAAATTPGRFASPSAHRCGPISTGVSATPAAGAAGNLGGLAREFLCRNGGAD